MWKFQFNVTFFSEKVFQNFKSFEKEKSLSINIISFLPSPEFLRFNIICSGTCFLCKNSFKKVQNFSRLRLARKTVMHRESYGSRKPSKPIGKTMVPSCIHSPFHWVPVPHSNRCETIGTICYTMVSHRIFPHRIGLPFTKRNNTESFGIQMVLRKFPNIRIRLRIGSPFGKPFMRNRCKTICLPWVSSKFTTLPHYLGFATAMAAH